MKLISAKELQDLELPPIEYVIDGLIPVGVTLLGAPPKSYKSYMCLDMGLSICQGKEFLGFKTHHSGCIYMDLESTLRRPKQRIDQILGGESAPENLYLVNNSPLMGAGFEDCIREQLTIHPDVKLVVVDVFKKIRPSKRGNVDSYERDYEDYGKIQTLANDLGIAIILVTHTTKMKHPDDPFNELSGSIGTTGSADASLVIKKENRQDKIAKLYVIGRDVEERCLEISFNKNTYKWEMLGTHADMEEKRFLEKYENSNVVHAIKMLVNTNGGKWTGTVQEIINASTYYNGRRIYDGPEKVGKEIPQFTKMLEERDLIEAFHTRTGSGRKWTFVYLFAKDTDTTVTTDTDVITDTTVTDAGKNNVVDGVSRFRSHDMCDSNDSISVTERTDE